MSTPHYEDATVTLHHGDCLDVLRELPDASVDSVVTDPPYGLEFMGKEWDAPWKAGADVHAQARDLRADEMGDENKRRYIASAVNRFTAGAPFQAWCELWTAECLRVLKPGGHLLAFGGTRTWHRLACAVEDAGFEVRDSLCWLYGSGFPKSLNPYRSIMGACPSNALAPHAVRLSRFIPLPSSAGKAPTALALARIQPEDELALLTETGEAGGSFVRTVTLLSELAANMSSSTDTLLRVLSDALYGQTSTSTTRTTTEPITVSRIWKCSQSLSTATSTHRPESLPDGCACPAFTAAGPSTVAFASSRLIPALTAPALVTAQPLRPLDATGTSLKPAHEPIVVARKPLAGTVAANVLAHGTGALNVDGCRIDGVVGHRSSGGFNGSPVYGSSEGVRDSDYTSGRWPANVVLDESQAEALDEMSGESVSPPVGSVARTTGVGDVFPREGRPPSPNGHGDSGGASRFFYVAKADASERVRVNGTAHPTVKPLALMRWLVRLVTPPGGTVLEPFAGSGTTVEACILEGFRCVAIEREADYLPLIVQRIHRRRDPVQAVKGAGEDGGLFDLLDGATA